VALDKDEGVVKDNVADHDDTRMLHEVVHMRSRKRLRRKRAANNEAQPAERGHLQLPAYSRISHE
jgi:hypothetical protein